MLIQHFNERAQVRPYNCSICSCKSQLWVFLLIVFYGLFVSVAERPHYLVPPTDALLQIQITFATHVPPSRGAKRPAQNPQLRLVGADSSSCDDGLVLAH